VSSPVPYLVRMLAFLAAVAAVVYFLLADLVRVFKNTPTLDAVILGVLVIGIFFVFRQVVILWPEITWLRRFQHREEGTPPPEARSINLLAPMAAMIGDRHDQIRLSPTAARALLDGIATRLDERRELARYMIGLLIFLGLLGTFWGLLQTISAVADAINGLQVAAGDPISMFARLKGSIEGPLKGMSTAFGASLFGLSGSLVLGFLELQASQAQGRFHSELEEWLARATSLSSPLTAVAGGAVPAYVEALLERNAEGTDNLVRVLQRVEESRLSAAAANTALIERLASLAETMRAQQNLLARFTELSIELRAAVARLSDRSGQEADREALAMHQRNVEAHLSRLIEETARHRGALADEVRALSSKVEERSSDDGVREELLAQQRTMEAQVVRVVDETAASRALIIEELRGLAARVADRTGATSDRDAVIEQQKVVETQVTRLTEETVRQGQELNDQLNNVMARLSDRSADVAAREALIAQQRSVESQIARLAEENVRTRSEIGDELRNVLQHLHDRPAATGPDAAEIEARQRSIEAVLDKVVEETGRVRSQISGELEDAVKRLSDRTLADAERQSFTAHQQNIEAHLGRLVEENGRNRETLAAELRAAIGELGQRFGDSDREALAAQLRSIEVHIARLTHDSEQSRTALADELRGEIRLLARTVAGGQAPTAAQTGLPPIIPNRDER